MKNPLIIRPGDKVLIENPLVFIRCGYPLGIEDGKKAVEHKRALVKQLLDYPENFLVDTTDTKAEDKILRVLAVRWLYTKGFGGKERTIHTVLLPDLKGAVMEVTSVKTVMTGRYCPGCSGSAWDDPEPPDLIGREAHRILEGYLPSANVCDPLLLIESIHVSKIHEDDHHSSV